LLTLTPYLTLSKSRFHGRSKEPELLEQIDMATCVYEGVAATRVREALAASAKLGRLRSEGGGGAAATEAAAAAEVVRLLDRASDLYAQALLTSIM
jgi:hypothetical protein